MDLRKYLGNQIRVFRERAGLSQEQLGVSIDVSKQTIYRVEKGLAWPEYENLEAIGAKLNVPLERFFMALAEKHLEPTPQEALEVLARVVNREVQTESPISPELARKLAKHSTRVLEIIAEMDTEQAIDLASVAVPTAGPKITDGLGEAQPKEKRRKVNGT